MVVRIGARWEWDGVTVETIPEVEEGNVALAFHDPISCHHGQPCVALLREIKERDIEAVLAHEFLHCLFYRQAVESGDPEADEYRHNDGVDVIMPTLEKTKELLGL